MMVVHLSTSDSGGAGIAASRIHQSLLEEGVESVFISLHKFRNDIPGAFAFKSIYSLELSKTEQAMNSIRKIRRRIANSGNYYSELSKKYLADRPQGFELFTLPGSEYDISRLPIIQEADIVHLHWVTEGFLDYKSFFRRINGKIVWTLHDMNPFTGGCHHSDECTGFMNQCYDCPQLKGTIDENLAMEVLKLKESSLHRLKNESMSIVSPSKWLLGQSAKSTLFKRFVHVNIANPVDENIFHPYDKIQARNDLGLPIDKKIILFIAKDVDNPRKGIRFIPDAISKMKNVNNVVLCSVGNMTEKIAENMEHINIGYVSDDQKMAMLYSAADVFVLPSLAENFPNTICESLMCGTPVVAFNVGGIPEMIHDGNGMIAPYKDTAGLANAIEKTLANSSYTQSSVSNDALNRFSLKIAAARYKEVYDKLLH